MKLNSVYVTVGTTKFDALIHQITSDTLLKILKSKGCQKLILQLGNGAPVDADKIRTLYNIDVEQYEFKFEKLRSDIVNSDLIIGHAGAGTCMDILNHKKPGLVVINEHLMNNHQMELAEQLAQDGYLFYCSVRELANRLETADFDTLKPYTEGKKNMQMFVRHLNAIMLDSS